MTKANKVYIQLQDVHNLTFFLTWLVSIYLGKEANHAIYPLYTHVIRFAYQ